MVDYGDLNVKCDTEKMDEWNLSLYFGFTI